MGSLPLGVVPRNHTRKGGGQSIRQAKRKDGIGGYEGENGEATR